jgi:methylated-DNA-[protein]-cysteine S-methyltransferase
MRFDERIWTLMRKIPKGRVTTYKILAQQINSRAYRAVGNACRRNPYAPSVPCHRVVKSDGEIGGFAGATSGRQIRRKIWMLRREGVKVKRGRVVNFERVLFRF